MRRSLLIVVASSALAFASFAGAQTASPSGAADSTPPAGPATTPPSSDPGPVNPPAAPPTPDAAGSTSSATPSAAASGAATSAVAPSPPAATGMVTRGMMVRDSAGAPLGRILRLDTSTNQTGAIIHLRRGQDITVPVSTLHAEGNAAVSSQTRAELQPASTTH